MTLVKFRYVTKDRDRHGNVRFYFRRPGKSKVRLRGVPGSDEFVDSYRMAVGEIGSCKASARKSFEWLCERYFKSGDFDALEENTRRKKRAVLGEICNTAGGSGQRLGEAPYASLKKVHVRKIRDLKAATPEAANHRLKQISALYTWAIRNDLAAINPAEKVEKLGGGSEGFYTWTEEDVDTFEAYWPAGSRPRLAMSIMLYLGVRRSDAIVIGKKHQSRDGGFVSFVQFKGRKKSAGKLLTLPILPSLRAVLDASPLGRDTWLETAYGRPYTNAGFGNAFKDWCREAGLPRCTAHGLRKAGAVRAAEAGASEHELMAMFGWEDADMARVYTRKAAQKRLAQSGAAKLLQSHELSHPLSHHQKIGDKSIPCGVNGGHARNRTGVRGFAVRCVTTPPRGL